jgi:hypothetical protein
MGKMNKWQWALTIVGLVATLLYSSTNGSKPISGWIDSAPYVIGGIALVIIFALIMPTRYCPNCKVKLQKLRFPKNANEALYGWTTCPNCKSEIDNNGNIVRR